jgi:DNA-binding NtrC family response regulator
MNPRPKILVVDDEEIVRRSYSRLLDGAHCETRVARNGEDAVSALASEPFDVVLLDLRMPGQDGMTVLKSIRTAWPASEVVILTGYPSVETAKEAVRMGAYDYLAKPVEPDKVIEVARRAARHKRWALHHEVQPRSMQ